MNSMNNYFKNDEYWKEHIKKPLEEDNWLDDYREYFSNSGLCLDLGCGIGQYTKKIMSYGYTGALFKSKNNNYSFKPLFSL